MKEGFGLNGIKTTSRSIFTFIAVRSHPNSAERLDSRSQLSRKSVNAVSVSRPFQVEAWLRGLSKFVDGHCHVD